MAKEKVYVRLEEKLLCHLKGKHNIENQSEVIRMAIMEILARDSSPRKIHTLYSGCEEADQGDGRKYGDNIQQGKNDGSIQ